MLHDIEKVPHHRIVRSERKLSDKPFVHEGAFVHQSKLGSWTEVGSHSVYIESVLNDYSYDAGDVSVIYAEIGKFCSIASHVRINPGNHPIHRVTQHHCTYRRKLFQLDNHDDEAFFNWRREHKCIIGHDVWIGHSAVIMPGVSIGTGAVVGSQAVVTKEVMPYEIVAGVPARPIRRRFPLDIIDRLLESHWWDWDREQLCEGLEDLCDINLFLEKYC
jgi:phosphonate metabolism protein (transferase hexapeptide repeat family)